MMQAVKLGGDRQELHEKIRVHSMEAGRLVKEEGKTNDLLERISNDFTFKLSLEELNALMNPENFVGIAPQQTEEFISTVIYPILSANKNVLGLKGQVHV